jgi:Na+-transporting NADH:ubiquinone oxidoreductase subunit C
MGERAYTLIYMAVVAAALTAGVAGAHLLTQGRIALNQGLAERRVVLAVLGLEVGPGATMADVDRAYGKHVSPTGLSVTAEDGTAAPILEGRDDDGALLGYAFRIAGQGFWDVVKGYVAVNPDLKTIRGVVFYQQNETPGLGAEISKDWFQQQFRGKALPQEPPSGTPVIRMVGPGVEPGPREVHAITGATGTSTAVERLLDGSLRAFLKAVHSRPQAELPASRTG